MPTTTSSYETPKTPKSIEELTTEAAVIGESTEKVINESDATADSFVPWSVLHLDDDDDDLQLDYEDYYLLDDPNDIRRLSDSDEDLKKSLIVLFHVGLWRACPFLLRDQLPASVGQTLNAVFFLFILFALFYFPFPFSSPPSSSSPVEAILFLFFSFFFCRAYFSVGGGGSRKWEGFYQIASNPGFVSIFILFQGNSLTFQSDSSSDSFKFSQFQLLIDSSLFLL